MTGGAIVRTDVCKRPETLANGTVPRGPVGKGASKCLVLEGQNSIIQNQATYGTGGGLLIVDVSTAYTDCGKDISPMANSTQLATRSLVPLVQCWAQAKSDNPVSRAMRGLPYNNTVEGLKLGPVVDLSTVVAKLKVACISQQEVDGQRALQQQQQDPQRNDTPQSTNCAVDQVAAGLKPTVVVPPGSPMHVGIAVVDWQGSRFAAGAPSRLPLQVGRLLLSS